MAEKGNDDQHPKSKRKRASVVPTCLTQTNNIPTEGEGQNSTSRGQLYPRAARSRVLTYDEEPVKHPILGAGTPLRFLETYGTEVGIRLSTIPRAGEGLFANTDFHYNPLRTKHWRSANMMV